MADIPRSSFIPKQTSGAVPTRVKKKRRFHALSYSATVVLIVSLALGGGTYFYKDYLQSDLQSEKQALEAERNRFNQGDIASVQELDYKLSVAKLLLDTHISPSKIFDALELTTRESIQFTNFSFTQQPGQSVALTITGGTEEFKSVALQALTYGADALFSGADITSIGNTSPGIDDVTSGAGAGSGSAPEHSVNFTVQGTVAGDSIVYDGNNALISEPVVSSPASLEEGESGAATTTQEGEEGVTDQ